MDQRDIFNYSVISVIILFFFTVIIKADISHLISIIVVTGVVAWFIYEKQTNALDNNQESEFKLNSILDNELPPDYFYTNLDLINLFFNIKQDLSQYNYDSYKNAVVSANKVLEIKYDIETRLCNSPKVPDVRKNFTPSKTVNIGVVYKDKANEFLNLDGYEFKDDKVCNSILENAYENYQVAEEFTKKSLNYLNSIVISLPSQAVFIRKHEKAVELLHILLKRELDIIKKTYDEKLKRTLNHKSKMITDYDLPKALNKFTDSDASTFNFY